MKAAAFRRFNVTLADIQDAKQEIHKHLDPSPLLGNAWLSEALGCQVLLKLENMQPIGSFKIRGAIYRISRLSAAERKRGVVAASAGNHAQGVAWASRSLGVRAMIVMPRGAPLVKIQNTRSLGAEIVLEGDSYDQAVLHARAISEKTGRVLIHAFEDPVVIAGQGTIGLEILEQCPDVDVVIGSIGGGGMMAGIAIALKALHPQARLVGCQAAGAASMVRSIEQGRAMRLESAYTFADGISVAQASPRMYALLAPRLDEIHEAGDEDIARAILRLLEKAKVVAEGAGALPLAVADKIRRTLKGRKVVLVISGGNIDVNLISRIIDRGLILSGRRVRVNALVSDRPGSLARLTETIARQGANILQAIHDRSGPSAKIDQTGVELTLETRGPEHSEELVEVLRKAVLRLDVLD